MKSFTIQTTRKIEVIDITQEVQSRVSDGKAVLIFAPHATAAITIGEFEPNIKQDYERFYSELCPKSDYAHNSIDDNAEAHLLSSFIKPSLVVPIENGELVLGTWQSILFVELDGPRSSRKIVIQTI